MPDEHNKPHRGRFPYSLRWLLIAVMLCGIPLAWIGYSLRWITCRHDMLDNLPPGMQYGISAQLGPGVSIPGGGFVTTTAPIILRPFGEQGIASFSSDKTVPIEQIEQIKMLFPEADTYCLWPGPHPYSPTR
jgi:hypothetical protein